MPPEDRSHSRGSLFEELTDGSDQIFDRRHDLGSLHDVTHTDPLKIREWYYEIVFPKLVRTVDAPETRVQDRPPTVERTDARPQLGKHHVMNELVYRHSWEFEEGDPF